MSTFQGLTPSFRVIQGFDVSNSFYFHRRSTQMSPHLRKFFHLPIAWKGAGQRPIPRFAFFYIVKWLQGFEPYLASYLPHPNQTFRLPFFCFSKYNHATRVGRSPLFCNFYPKFPLHLRKGEGGKSFFFFGEKIKQKKKNFGHFFFFFFFSIYPYPKIRFST